MTEEERREKKHSKVDDAEEIREIFAALNESIPNLISGLIASVYEPERAVSIARSIGRFYATLKEEGIPDELALQMTKDYASSFNLSNVMELAGMRGAGKKKIVVEKHHTQTEAEEVE